MNMTLYKWGMGGRGKKNGREGKGGWVGRALNKEFMILG